MTWALVTLAIGILGSLTTCLLVVRSAHKDEKAATALAMGEQKQRIQAQDDLRLADMTIKAKTAEIEILKERLATAEQQRNEAYAHARDELVERIKQANVADATALVRDLVATDIRPGVLPSKARSDDPRDYLLDPDA